MVSDASKLSINTVPVIGALVRGGYGHTSVYHKALGEIFVYGGYVSGDQRSQYTLTDFLYSFSPQTKTW